MKKLHIMRLEAFKPQPVGVIDVSDASSFRYLDEYLETPQAIPLSASLPLRREPFSEREMRPYFEGLLPEGAARTALAGELQLAADDYLSMLEACGKDCIGDVVVSENPCADVEGSYEDVSLQQLDRLFANGQNAAAQNAASRLSLAGTQTKTGLAHLPWAATDEGWLRPVGFAATTHILKASHLRDVPENEYICMKAAKECGIPTAEVALIDAATPVLSVERFDRVSCGDSAGTLSVARQHQEDLAQALGVETASKYAEIEGGTVRAIAGFLRRHGASPVRDIANFAKMLCFAYVIGDCDAHLKNFSVLVRPTGDAASGSYAVSLSPAYDFVCTTMFARFSRDMAMDFGGARAIDDVTPSTFARLADDLGISAGALAELARPIVCGLFDAIDQAEEGEFGDVLESTPYIADDMSEDIAPRLEMLRTFCS